jgi:hypothetical protein
MKTNKYKILSGGVLYVVYLNSTSPIVIGAANGLVIKRFAVQSQQSHYTNDVTPYIVDTEDSWNVKVGMYEKELLIFVVKLNIPLYINRQNELKLRSYKTSLCVIIILVINNYVFRC